MHVMMTGILIIPKEEQVVNNVNITVVNKSAVDYLQSQPELSSMYQLFSETGVLDEMVEKNLLFTILSG